MLKIPYLHTVTSGANASWWAKFRTPLESSRIVTRNTYIPIAQTKEALDVSAHLKTLIKNPEWHNYDARFRAVATFGLRAARVFYGNITLDTGECPVDMATVEIPPWSANTAAEVLPLQEGIQKVLEDASDATAQNHVSQTEIERLKNKLAEAELKLASLNAPVNVPPYTEMVTAYLLDLKTSGGHGGRPVNPVHYRQRERHLTEFWPSKLALNTIADVKLPDVTRIANELITAELASKTVQLHVDSIKALCLWAKKMKYVRDNPLDGIKKFQGVAKNERRALTAAELAALLKVAPADRALIYRVAAVTGYRKSEINALKVSNLIGSALQLSGESTKNKKKAVQLLPNALAATLAASAEGKDKDGQLLPVPFHIDRLFKRDLTAAGIEDDALTFHSLRHTTATLLANSGATVKEAQTLMRHSDPRLTMNVYTHTEDARMRELVEGLGKLV